MLLPSDIPHSPAFFWAAVETAESSVRFPYGRGCLHSAMVILMPISWLLLITRRLIMDAMTPAVIEAAEHGGWSGELWERLEAQGLLQPSAIAESSDANEGLEIEAAVLRAAAATAVPLPVAETAARGWFLARHSIEVPNGVLSVASFGCRGEAVARQGPRERTAGKSAVGTPCERHSCYCEMTS